MNMFLHAPHFGIVNTDAKMAATTATVRRSAALHRVPAGLVEEWALCGLHIGEVPVLIALGSGVANGRRRGFAQIVAFVRKSGVRPNGWSPPESIHG